MLVTWLYILAIEIIYTRLYLFYYLLSDWLSFSILNFVSFGSTFVKLLVSSGDMFGVYKSDTILRIDWNRIVIEKNSSHS